MQHVPKFNQCLRQRLQIATYGKDAMTVSTIPTVDSIPGFYITVINKIYYHCRHKKITAKMIDHVRQMYSIF